MYNVNLENNLPLFNQTTYTLCNEKYSNLKSLNDKITTYGQSINMNNYEYNLNNKILIVLGLIFGVIFSIFIVILVYYVNLLSRPKVN